MMMMTIIIIIIIIIITAWNGVLLDKRTVSQLVKKFFASYEIRRLSTMFTRADHLSQINPVPPPPLRHTVSWRSILILLFTLRSAKLYLSLRFPHQNPVCTSPLPHSCHMLRPSDSSLFGRWNICWAVQIVKLLIMPSPAAPLYLVMLGPSFLLSALFSKHCQPMLPPQCERPIFTPI
jgi:hypothetical protein